MHKKNRKLTLNNYSDNLSNIFKIGLIILLNILSIYFIYALQYVAASSSIVADDFMHTNQLKEWIGDNVSLLKASFLYGYLDYMRLGSRYFTMFMQTLLGTYNNNFLEIHSLVMRLNIILYAITFYIFIFSIIYNIIYKNNNKNLLDIFLITSIFHFGVGAPLYAYIMNNEMWYWLSTATSYSMPLICIYISFILFLNIDNIKNKFLKHKFVFLIIIFGFFGFGGNIQCSIFAYGLVLLYFIYNINDIKNIDKSKKIIYIIYTVLFLLVLFAPGNMKRKMLSEYNTSFDPYQQIINYVNNALPFIFDKFNNSIIKSILICSGLLIGIIQGKNVILNKMYILISILLLFLPIATFIVVAYGYMSLPEFYFPSRVQFLIDLSIYINIINISMIVGYIIFKLILYYNKLFAQNELINKKSRKIKKINNNYLSINTIYVLLIFIILSIPIINIEKRTFGDAYVVLAKSRIEDGTYDNFKLKYDNIYKGLKENEGLANVYYIKHAAFPPILNDLLDIRVDLDSVAVFYKYGKVEVIK